MASKNAIIEAIKDKVGSTKYSSWRVGLTHDPKQRKADWNNPGSWSLWTADSLSDAQDIESFFIKKGMQGGTGGDLSSRSTTYVYLF
jgi:hypothetical protein